MAQAQIVIYNETNGQGLGTPVLLIDNQCFLNWDVFEYDGALYLLGIKRDQKTLTLTEGTSLSREEDLSPDEEFSLQDFTSLFTSGKIQPRLKENPTGETPSYRGMMENYLLS